MKGESEATLDNTQIHTTEEQALTSAQVMIRDTVHEPIDPERLQVLELPLVTVRARHVRDRHLALPHHGRPLPICRRELHTPLHIAVRRRKHVQPPSLHEGRVEEGEWGAGDRPRVVLEQRVLASLELLRDGTVERVLQPLVHGAVAEQVREQPVCDACGVGEHAPHERLECIALVAGRHP